MLIGEYYINLLKLIEIYLYERIICYDERKINLGVLVFFVGVDVFNYFLMYLIFIWKNVLFLYKLDFKMW